MGLSNIISKVKTLVGGNGASSSTVQAPSSATTATRKQPEPQQRVEKTPEVPPDADIHPNMTMGRIVQEFPSAQRVLFQQYHIGGCSSCGYQPTETLGQVLAREGIEDVESVLDVIRESAEREKDLQISVEEAARQLTELENAELLDVRDDYERRQASIPGSKALTQDLVQEIMQEWDKDTPLFFYCHHGIRSLDAASYFAGHDFTNVKSIEGGIDAWAQKVNPEISRY